MSLWCPAEAVGQGARIQLEEDLVSQVVCPAVAAVPSARPAPATAAEDVKVAVHDMGAPEKMGNKFDPVTGKQNWYDAATPAAMPGQQTGYAATCGGASA